MASAESYGDADKSNWAFSIALGALIALAAFTSILWAVGWLISHFLHTAGTPLVLSRWERSLPLINVLILNLYSVIALIRYYRKRRGKQSA